MSRNHLIVPLVFLLLIAAGLRLWRLDALPPGLHFDEAVYGLMAQEISAGARPVFFPSFVGREPLYMYLIALVYQFSGVNVIALRLAAALAGLATVPAMYLLGASLFSRRVGLVAAALAALGFWPLFISRIAYPVGLIPLLTAASVALLWHGHRARRWWAFAAGGALAGLSLYTYPAARLFPVALLLMAAVVAAVERRDWRTWLGGWLIALAAALLVFAPLGSYFAQHPEQLWERASQVLVTKEQPLSALPGILWRQTAAVAGAFVWRGDPIPLYNDPGQAAVDWLVRPFFVLGLALAIRGWRQLPLGMLTLWLVGAGLPAVLTRDPVPAFLRLTGAIPPMLLLAAVGMDRSGQWLQRLTSAALKGGPTTLVGRWLTPSTLVLLLVLEGGTTAWRYFGDWGRRDDLGYWFEADHVRLAAAARDELAAGRTVVIGAEHFRHPTVLFLAPETGAARWVSGYQSMVFPAGAGSAVYLWPTSYFPLDSRFGQALAERGPVSLLEDSLGRRSVAHVVLGSEAYPTGVGPSPALWEDLSLLAASPSATDIPRGISLTVELLWQALRRPDAERRFSLALVDDQGVRWAQTDALGYAAEQWRAGDRALQWLDLRPAATLPPGDYRLRLGLANERSEPLAFRSDSGAQGLFLDLGSVTLRQEGALVQPVSGGASLGHVRLLEHTAVEEARRPGQQLTVSARWQATAPFNGGTVVVEAVDASGGARALLERAVAGWGPWLLGEVRDARYLVTVPADLAPGDYRLRLRLPGDGAALPMGRLRVETTDRLVSLPATAIVAPATFGGRAQLLGHAPLPSVVRPGETLTVALYWQTAASGGLQADDPRVFVHLLGPDGRLYGQHDGVPAEGRRPVAGWSSGEVIEDIHRFVVAPAAPAATYQLEIGLYDGATLQRWSGETGGAALAEDRLLIGPIEVARQ